ncbi:hypothetical protein NBRC10512_007776 [Rhodotorula toruloides]|uniref:RHTO0S01e17106g1_1 n=2 Tax=Rhodotorula toruloides TaxID=5286 RepID=A0A061AF72_RHOTO|nr:actin-related protein [Rhodotorula toruloides NP11]EMS19656.1 actin-related protein [Rhodotorula toruloides NP11]KAJ8293978.1 Actin-related protein 4 [Rhodotorula toruloides]CDR36231.1 RHTO0S01e17106g1_1 [Rhodotorula toruloides]
MVVRDDVILIFDLTSTLLRAGVGVHDLIRGPLVELPTRVGRMAGKAGTRVEDFLVGAQLAAAEAVTAAGGVQDFDIIDPIRIDERTGFEVTDWTALEAVFRYAMHTSMQLQRPPLAHPTVLCIPPSLPQATVDDLHRLLFERLLIPQLLVSSRPFFAAGAAGVLSCVVIDVGYRGEGTEITAVHENQVLEAPSGMRNPFIDEGACDDYCALQLLEADSTIADQFKAAKGADAELSTGELVNGLRRIVHDLKVQDKIAFQSPFLSKEIAEAAALQAAAMGVEVADEGTFDVAKVVVEGKVSEVVQNKGKGKDGEEEEGDFVRVPNPFHTAQPGAGQIDLTTDSSPKATIRIGPARHRYLEPLFFPPLLASLAPSASSTAARLGMSQYERFATSEGKALLGQAGVHEMVGVVLSDVPEGDVRTTVSEAVVVVSSGRVANNRSLGATLVPLLSPFRSDASAAPYDPEGPPFNRATRYARTPDYFANFKDRAGDWACYLGGCIMGKLLLGDTQSKLFTTKADYAMRGPSYYRRLDTI